jgi:hypothetical protein
MAPSVKVVPTSSTANTAYFFSRIRAGRILLVIAEEERGIDPIHERGFISINVLEGILLAYN